MCVRWCQDEEVVIDSYGPVSDKVAFCFSTYLPTYLQ